MFGELRSAREGLRGRPEHVPSPENVRKVRALVLAGWKVSAIAAEMGVSAPTLRKVYFRDLARARDEVRAQAKARLLIALETQVALGNVGAMRALWKIVEQDELRALPAAMTPKKAALGKKDQRKAAAHKPTGRWDGLIPGAPADLIQ